MSLNIVYTNLDKAYKLNAFYFFGRPEIYNVRNEQYVFYCAGHLNLLLPKTNPMLH